MRWWLALGAVGLCWSAGCGEGPGREDVLVSGLTNRFCEKMAECGCLTPEEILLCSPDEVGLDENDEPNELAYDAACADELEGLIAEVSCTDPQPLSFADLCPLYHGTLFEGQACGAVDPFRGVGPIDGGEAPQDLGACGPGLQCILGECRDPATVAYGAENQPCDLTGCDEGLTCQAGICIRLPGPGELCLESQCREDSRCVFDPMGVQEPVCEALANVGEPCMGHAECVSGNCPAGFCEAPAGTGAECGGNLPCGAGFECVQEVDPQTGQSTGVCSPLAGVASNARCESFFLAFDIVAG